MVTASFLPVFGLIIDRLDGFLWKIGIKVTPHCGFFCVCISIITRLEVHLGLPDPLGDPSHWVFQRPPGFAPFGNADTGTEEIYRFIGYS